ncbi:MAG: 2-oxo acid dehydrogenase subunit E2 [Cyanobacteria bacterium]|nr:2-oxo acid dehydrogenase subunit E2 [Cyanobacteriota bacterium]
MAVEFRLPDIGEGIAEGEIVQWLVKPGDSVKEDQALVEVMTDKVTAEIPSPYTGVVAELRGKAGETVKVGSVIVVFSETGAAPAKETQAASVTEPVKIPAAVASETLAANGHNKSIATLAYDSKVLAAPATRKMARELGVSLNALQGTGPKGRITPTDVQNFKQAGGGIPRSNLNRLARIELERIEREERVPFAGLRKKIAEHLVHAKQVAPHFAYVEEVEMTAICSVKDQLAPLAEQRGVKLTYLPLIMKAVIAALKEYPVLNSSLDDAKQELVYKKHFHMGVAVATAQGLIVPVVKFADQKSVFELAEEIKQLSDKARAGKLTLDELKGGTFTLTSIGSIGGIFGVPIINHPEVAIMGINKIEKRPVVRDNQVVIRDMMYLSMSCDHRVVDGAEAALFMKRLIQFLEAPVAMLLEPSL